MNEILNREQRTVLLSDFPLSYELRRKKVKNINLHVRSGQVWVSAPSKIPVEMIEGFIRQKSRAIRKALQYSVTEPEAVTPEMERIRKARCQAMILPMCRDFYAGISDWEIPYPEIRFRKMSSRWGSCNPVKGVLTFSTMLADMPLAFVSYVVAHEFVHFRQANHSKAFYQELARFVPDYRERRRMGVKCRVDKP